MTIERRADLALPTILGDLAGSSYPDYVDDVLLATAQLPQRRVAASIQRWLPMGHDTGTSVVGPRIPWRGLAVALVIIALLLAASVVLLTGAARRQLAPPFGLAQTGLVAFEADGDLVATLPDGTGRRDLITGDGEQWGAMWSHRGDRFAYWSAPTTADPASLWVADRDGSNRQLISDGVANVADLLPSVGWSPDDRQLAFSADDVLYVVDADGTDLHPVGPPGHTRGGPVWSPDGSLIAYTGQPLNDLFSTSSVWVMAPDGTRDEMVIPAEGGSEIANVNPSWSPDSRSLLSHDGDGTMPNSIWIAQRDDTGAWSHRRIVSGSTWNYLPAWSTTGTRFTFLRGVDRIGAGVPDPTEFVVMVADADGQNVQQLAERHVPLSTPCWTPDDRFIRADSLGSGTDRTIVLFPLDGSQSIDLPARADGSSAGCPMQRLAP